MIRVERIEETSKDKKNENEEQVINKQNVDNIFCICFFYTFAALFLLRIFRACQRGRLEVPVNKGKTEYSR